MCGQQSASQYVELALINTLQLLNMEAEKRLSFDEVLSHPWILGHTKGPEKESQMESCESPNWVSHSVDLDDPDL